MKFIVPKGGTPIDADERNTLIPKHISLQSELNAWEQLNILEAQEWAFNKKHKNIFSTSFLQKLHEKMFNQTWEWAGKFRKTLKNIGVEAFQIPMELKMLCDNTVFQIENCSYPFDEIATRLHHRLVWIHAFSNGNGRHARLYTDLLLTKNGYPKFSWGESYLKNTNKMREIYISALRKADEHDFMDLLKFVQS